MAGAEPISRREASATDGECQERAQALFQRGDFRALRRQRAQDAGRRSADPRFDASLRVDPVHAAVLIGCALLLLAIAAYYLGVAR